MRSNQLFGKNINSVTGGIRKPADLIKNVDLFHREDIITHIRDEFPKNEDTVINIALHDLIAKKLKAPLYKLLDLRQHTAKVTSLQSGLILIPSKRCVRRLWRLRILCRTNFLYILVKLIA